MSWAQTNFVSLVAATLLVACGGGGSAVMAVVEAQVPQSATCPSVTHLQVPVTGVRIGRGSGEQAQTFTVPRTIDLMAPGAGILQSLGLAPLGAGDATQIRLTTMDGTVSFSNGSTAILKIPGGTTVSASTELPAGALADLVVPAFDPCSLHAAGNSGQWLFTGDVAAQLRTLPFSTAALQLVAGPLRPLPGGGWAIVQPDGIGGFVAQRFDSFGNALGGPVSITLPLGAGDTAPTLTLLASGYLATWLGPSVNPQVPQANGFPLFAQLLDATGNALAAPAQVAITTPVVSNTVPGSLPRAAALPDGGAALVWVQLQSGSLNIFLQRFSATGPVGSPQRVNVTAAQGLPNVVGLDNGGVLVVWGGGPLFARVFAPDGTAGPQQSIAPDAASLSGAVALSAAPDGGAAVAWEAQLGSGVVFVERLGPDGAPTAAPQSVTGVAAAQSSPSVGVLADGSAVVAWIEAPAQVLARRFAADGTPVGAAQVVVGSHATAPVVAPLAWGGFLIEASTSGGFVARLFDARGLEG